MADLELDDSRLEQATSHLRAALDAGSPQCLALPGFGSPRVGGVAGAIDGTLVGAAAALDRVVADAKGGVEAISATFAAADTQMGQQVR